MARAKVSTSCLRTKGKTLASVYGRGTTEMPGVELTPDRLGALEPQGLLREALAAGKVGIWSWDLAADAFSADAVTRELWCLPEGGNISAEQVMGAVNPMDVAAFRAAALAARVTGEFHTMFRLRSDVGEPRWLRVRGRNGKKGRKERLVGVAIDITERKRAEADLSQTEERLQRAQELGGAIPFEWDGRHDRLIAHPSFKALYGVGADEPFDLKTFLERVHPDDRARVEEDHRRLMAAPGPYEAEFRAILPDGSTRWILSRGEAVRDGKGDPLGIAGINMDITTRKQIEEDLRRSKREARARFRELKALYQNAPVGLALLDRDLKFLRINEALARLNGLPVETHIGRYAFDIVPDLRQIAEPLLREVLETAKPIANIEIEGETPQEPGVRRTWVEQFYPVKDDAGRVIGIGIVCEDVTEHRRTERTRDLLSRELSHRIKNLFAVISSIVRLSARGNEAVQPFAKVIGGRIEALGRAHDYVRPVGSDHEGPARSDRSLHNLMKAILEPWAEEGARILVGGDDPAIGSAAATALALAIHECATNAVKYGALSTPEGRVDITCRMAGDDFEMVWTERGGPPIDQPPIREGFGTTLARRSIAGELAGTIAAEWAPEGLTLRIKAPTARLGH
jgi:PAS domain S-box-containing protein